MREGCLPLLLRRRATVCSFAGFKDYAAVSSWVHGVLVASIALSQVRSRRMQATIETFPLLPRAFSALKWAFRAGLCVMPASVAM